MTGGMILWPVAIVDRDAARSFLSQQSGVRRSEIVVEDHHPLVQVLAAHRLAHRPVIIDAEHLARCELVAGDAEDFFGSGMPGVKIHRIAKFAADRMARRLMLVNGMSDQ